MENTKAPETNKESNPQEYPSPHEKSNEVNEPDYSYNRYSYADYITWSIDEMVEIIRGRVFKMNAPKRIHQEISGYVFVELYQFLKSKPCKVYEAPFDVRLPTNSKRNEDIYTVVQPDICVICDKNKLDDAGCLGAPDLIIEILSKGNNRKELQNKYEIYEESGVSEYWIIHPEEQTVLIYTLEAGSYKPSRLFTNGDIIGSKVLPDFQLYLEDVFSCIN